MTEAPNRIARAMRTFLSIFLGAAVGMVVGGVSSFFVVLMMGAVFHWEMAGAVMSIVAAFVGGIAGGLSAGTGVLFAVGDTPLMKVGIGLCLGMFLGLVIGLFVVANSSVNHPNAPEGLAFWSVAVVVIGGSLAGGFGGLVANRNKTNNG